MRKKQEIPPQIAAYDKIVKENLTALLPRLLAIFNIEFTNGSDIKENLQRTKERRPDLLQRVFDKNNKEFILHVEFQVGEERIRLVFRMGDYYWMLKSTYDLPIVQYVVFLSDSEPNPITEIRDENLWYRYKYIWFKSIDFEFFLQSDNPDDIIFAILGDFKNMPDELVANKIIDRLVEKQTSELGFEKSIEQLRILSNLRNLQPKIDTIMEKISKYFKEENDYFYRKGKEREKEYKEKIFVSNLIEGTDFSSEKIASLADVSVEFVEQIRKELKEKRN